MKLQTKTILRFSLTSQNGKDQWTNPQQTLEGMQGKREPSFTAGGTANWCNYYENQHSDSQKSKNKSVIKQIFKVVESHWHSWASEIRASFMFTADREASNLTFTKYKQPSSGLLQQICWSPASKHSWPNYKENCFQIHKHFHMLYTLYQSLSTLTLTSTLPKAHPTLKTHPHSVSTELSSASLSYNRQKKVFCAYLAFSFTIYIFPYERKTDFQM